MERRRGLPDPRREASWLLAAALGLAEIRLRMDPEAEVPEQFRRQFLGWVERRAAGEPAEHLVGRCEFWGRFFRVTPDVLIPRPETELLLKAALDLPVPETASVLDVGTGSGCLATTMALERPGWRVTAVDRSAAAIAVARRNGEDLGGTVGWVLGDLVSAVAGPFDLVVANLPYLPTAWLSELPLEVQKEPTSALDGGVDGLDLVRTLLDRLERVLKPGGLCLLELAEDQASAVECAAADRGLALQGRHRDFGGCDRIVVLTRPSHQ